ncbi:MAG TPA: hypothetical protein VFS51_10340 [Gemmatimonadales bacterium]|nr:hypothetical protein [Gemmatimonadales bacterium]
MTSTARMTGEYDVTHVPAIVQGAVLLGLLESILVLLFSVATRFLPSPLEAVVGGIILLVGLAAVTMLPGTWTRARTVEGIAGAAGIGLAAAVVFLLIDVILLQNIGTYSHRWHAIGGGSNWWYHPVWWMGGAFLPWMGAWILANQTDKSGRPSVVTGLVTAFAFTVVVAVLAVVLGFPGAGWSLATFGIAFMPGLVLATVLSAIGKRRA